ncbi:MAG TPA: ABC transporter ATP-binding protein [Gemmatimonadaceae bacterium]|jgi:subfamily B ATP-binding cassette protein MsbA|nr:ABC transporter ATP-binding protein [Gemmatimonadaceae bacterium]
MMYRRLLQFLRPHAWRMAGTVGCNIAAAVLDVFSFTLLIPFLDRLFNQPAHETKLSALQNQLLGTFLNGESPEAALLRIVIIILVAVTAKNVFVWASGQLGAQLQEYVTRDLRNALYAHLQRLPLGFFVRVKTGDILARVLNDTQQTKQVITQVVTQSLLSVATVVVTIAGLIAISWRLTLLALVVAPILIGLLQPLLRKLRKGHRRLSNQYGEMTAVVQEAVSGIRLVKSFGGEAYEEGRFREGSSRYAGGMVRVTRIAALAQPITETVGTAIAVAILWFGARAVFAGTLDGANLIAFLILVMRMLQPLKQLSQVPTVAQQSLAAAERIFEVIDSPTEASLDRGTIANATFERALEFERVSFAYADEPVLVDVSLVAPKGQVIALVGASGAGKSTLVDLIPRFYEPTAGRILLDGTDTREIALPALRSLIGIVSQDTVLFNDTVRNNLAYGAAAKYTDAQIEAAARAANAHRFIAELPDGYDTILGERGTRLSGGQRQRLSIARALLVDPPILILDEATSALDTESERLVQEAIDRLLEGRTVFVIAHRLSTIAHADQILVMDRGRVVEHGTHGALLARRGHYHRLHALQFADAREMEARARAAESPVPSP